MNDLPEFVEFRLRTHIPQEELNAKKGKLLTPADVNVMLTGPTRVLLPNNEPLCVYWPGAIPEAARVAAYPALHSVKDRLSHNRGKASASPGRYMHGKRSYSYVDVSSHIAGAYEGNSDGGRNFCRLTAWTGRNFPLYETTWPLLQRIAECFEAAVPHRYAAQMAYVQRTQPEWTVPGTPFTTITVNNTYATGVHVDKGDLAEGYSALAVLRRNIAGGALVFPEWRVGVELRDGDLILMDAHHFHGNLPLEPLPELDLAYKYEDHYGPAGEPERISVVAYYRTRVADCGTAEEEAEKQQQWADQRLARAHLDLGAPA